MILSRNPTLFKSSGLALLLIALASPACAAAEPETILMVDDHEILYRSGTERVVHPLRRQSEKAIIVADKPWEKANRAQSAVRRFERDDLVAIFDRN